MSVSLARILCVTFLLLLPACYAKLPCDKKWKGPSDSNSLNDCDLQTYFADTYGVYVVAPIVLAILMFVVIPIILCARYCCNCCGGFRRSPNGGCCGGTTWNERPETEKNAHYLATHVTASKIAVIVVLVLGIVGLACCVAGASGIQKAFDDTWSSTDNLITWLQNKVKSMRTKLTRSDGTLVGSLIPGDFDNINKQIENVRSSKNDLKDQFSSLWQPVVTASYVMGVVPIIAFVTGVILAYCNIRRCGPLVLILLSWFVGTLFWILAFAIGLTNVILVEFCDEVDAQKTKAPGVMQWYAIPVCNKSIPLSAAKDLVTTAEKVSATAACNALMTTCENSDVYNAQANPSVVYYCPLAADVPRYCTTFSSATYQIVNVTRAKSTLPRQLCTDVTNTQCTIAKCSQTCSDGNAKTTSANSISALLDANRAFTAFNEDVAPMLDCNALYDKAFEVFSSCSTFVAATTVGRAGLIVYAVGMWCLAITMMFGQKRFFPAIEASASEGAKPPEGGYYGDGQQYHNNNNNHNHPEEMYPVHYYPNPIQLGDPAHPHPPDTNTTTNPMSLYTRHQHQQIDSHSQAYN
eukprot:PhF_6_TR9223/c0_g1_i1/m.14506